MSDYEKRRKLTEKLDKRIKLENTRKKYKTKIKKEQSRTAFEKAKATFSIPFTREAFDKLLTAMLAMIVTIIFASCSGTMVIAMLFCAIVDVLYLAFYVIAFPFILLYFAVFKGARIKSLERKLKKVNEKLSKGKSSSALKKELAECEARIKSSSSSSSSTSTSYSSSSGITDTEYYKEAVDRYYRTYMGFPPKEGDSLPDRATDTTLDMHPGDY